MKKLLQINTVVNSGSTGRIAEEIGLMVMGNGWESTIAYGRNPRPSKSNLIKIGTKTEIYAHVAKTRVFDAHGLGSVKGTKKLIDEIKVIEPDIIHLHNIHGYYLNIKILFEFLSKTQIPVVWTLHDCWSYTGHCIHYTYVDCQKWQTDIGCHSCPQKKTYPASFVFDRSKKNFELKRNLFTSLSNLTLVPASNWLKNELKKSFLKNQKIRMIHNGIDLKQFSPKESEKIKSKYTINNKFIILGVANPWSDKKGLGDFVKLSKLLKKDQQIVLVGLTNKQIRALPENIIGIERTESIKEMASLYSLAGVFANPTWEDNYPTTNLEAIACGTPVITYKTGGSPESIGENTGFVIPQGDIQALKKKIDLIQSRGKAYYGRSCREFAIESFDKKDRFEEYFALYEELLS